MAYLTREERQKLRDQLSSMSFAQAKGKLQRMDPNGRLVYFRNNQKTGEWLTRYDLAGLGTRVTLIEAYRMKPKSGKLMADYELVNVVVEPSPENRT